MSSNDPETTHVTLEYNDEMAAEHRDLAYRSITAMMAGAQRTSEARRRARSALDAAAAQVRRSSSAEGQPAGEKPQSLAVDESDPAVAAALAAVADQQRDLLSAAELDPLDVPLPDSFTQGMASADAGFADQVFSIPFHYNWQWHIGRPAALSTADLPSGRVTLWVMNPPETSQTNAHAGFGVHLTTDHDHFVTARSLRRSWESYHVKTHAGWALAEGGAEMTVFEGGARAPKDADIDKRFRKRVSGAEEDWWDSGGFGTGNPIELTWFMRAGRGYTLNVGFWVYCDWDSGPGASGSTGFSTSSLKGDALAITVFHH